RHPAATDPDGGDDRCCHGRARQAGAHLVPSLLESTGSTRVQRSSIRRLRRLHKGGARSSSFITSRLGSGGVALEQRVVFRIRGRVALGSPFAFQRKSSGVTKRGRMSGALKTEDR